MLYGRELKDGNFTVALSIIENRKPEENRVLWIYREQSFPFLGYVIGFVFPKGQHLLYGIIKEQGWFTYL
ncbi:hypothetical protein LX92_00282 [Maribacter polysiphoniae]|uniref:Uncharacterized protein n=1 Tax=Maribacter polysiphoniae TaxID=429344 RepID=A0A316ER51_9FLAO|nr:hypothetical protein LX92_00282 [Maribacter polysiphoniae]